jgi:hypothetical protein
MQQGAHPPDGRAAQDRNKRAPTEHPPPRNDHYKIRRAGETAGQPQVSGRAPGARTRNLWIKSPQPFKNSLLDALPCPASEYPYMPFGPRSPFASQHIGPAPYRVLPGHTATYEQTPSKHASSVGRCSSRTVTRIRAGWLDRRRRPPTPGQDPQRVRVCPFTCVDEISASTPS